MPIKWAIELEYIGKGFAGSQIQCIKSDSRQRIDNPDIRTVQGELEKALRTLIKTEVKTIFSGRTDAGVNAKGQMVHFLTEDELDEGKFLYSLNSLLPDDISVKRIERKDERFHAQKSARWRWYRYVINNNKTRSVWDIPSLSVRKELNTEEINKALEYLIGEHDFSAFKCSKSLNPAKICNIYYAKASCKSGIINIDIVGDRFLYNMVRIIVGTLLDFEKNSFSPSKMKEIIASKDRTKAGATESPDGLYLMKVGYDKEDYLSWIKSSQQ